MAVFRDSWRLFSFTIAATAFAGIVNAGFSSGAKDG
jgi:hypothetical protein